MRSEPALAAASASTSSFSSRRISSHGSTQMHTLEAQASHLGQSSRTTATTRTRRRRRTPACHIEYRTVAYIQYCNIIFILKVYINQTGDEPQKQDTQANKRSPLLSEEVPYQYIIAIRISVSVTAYIIHSRTYHNIYIIYIYITYTYIIIIVIDQHCSSVQVHVDAVI